MVERRLDIKGQVDLTGGADASQYRVEVRDPRDDRVLGRGTVDDQGRFLVRLVNPDHAPHPAQTKHELAKRHHGISRLFGLHDVEEKLLSLATGDLVEAGGEGSVAADELKRDLHRLRADVAHFVSLAPHFAAAAEGRAPSREHANLEVHIHHRDDRGGAALVHPLAVTAEHDALDLGALGRIEASHDPDHWAYDPDDDFPRRKWGKQKVDSPVFSEGWTIAYLRFLTERRVPTLLKPYGVLTKNFLHKDELRDYWSFKMDMLCLPGIATVFEDNRAAQACFPGNASQKAKAELGVRFLPDDYLVTRLLQGMHPVMFRTSTVAGADLEVGFSWDAYEQGTDLTLNNVTAYFAFAGDPAEMPALAFIDVDGTRHTPTGNTATWDEWNWAKYQFMVSVFLAGEADSHLTRAHLNMEQYAVPMMMHLSADNPMRQVMGPHLRDVWGINNFGTILIFGETGVLAKSSALTARGVRDRLKDCLGGEDWRGYHPRAPLCDAHDYAHAANVFWSVAREHVEEWFAEHWDIAPDRDRARWWQEIERFSRDLVAHAVPYVPTYGGGEGLLGHTECAPGTDRQGRAKTGAVSGLETLDDVFQVCTYVLFHCTMLHDWSNDRQFADGGDLYHASLGLREKQPPTDGDWEAWWARAEPPPGAAAYTLFLSYFLSNLRWGYLLGRPPEEAAERTDHVDHDEEKQIAALLKVMHMPRNGGPSAAELLEGWGQPLDNIRARINT